MESTTKQPQVRHTKFGYLSLAIAPEQKAAIDYAAFLDGKRSVNNWFGAHILDIMMPIVRAQIMAKDPGYFTRPQPPSSQSAVAGQ